MEKRQEATLTLESGRETLLDPGQEERTPKGKRVGDTGVTAALHAWRDGDGDACGDVFEKLRVELKSRAASRMSRERKNHTLQPTALVNELFLRWQSSCGIDWEDRTHFLAFASRAMGQILVDHARKHRAKKRGDDYQFVVLDESFDLPQRQTVDAVDLGTILIDLERLNERKRRIVEYHGFGHLTLQECADVLGVSKATAKRDWRFARAWLTDYLAKAEKTA